MTGSVVPRGVRPRGRLAVVVVAGIALLGPLAWWWQDSLLPGAFAVTDMGYADYGGGPAGAAPRHGGGAHAPGAGTRSLTSLVADPLRPADVSVTLAARKQRFQLPSGRTVDGYTLNGRSPGPVIRAVQGQFVEVRLVNESVPDGVTLHWHGVDDVPNGHDGVAGVTQDAVLPGQRFAYRFLARRVGTYWYHSHQVSHEQVRRGLLGAVVVVPAAPTAPAAGAAVDVVALVHLYDGVRTVNGQEGDIRAEVPPGRRARVRVINSDAGEMAAWVAGAGWRLVAIDGVDVHEPPAVRDTSVAVAAGGRVDIEVTMPDDGAPVRVALGGSAAVVLGSASHPASYAAAASRRPGATLDPLVYGTPAPLRFDPESPDRRFRYDVGRRPGFVDGRPGLWWTVNGHRYPDIPMFVVARGDVVRMRVSNHSGDAHPMHLHGHHAVVLARDGVAATGSPWWTDSLTVGNNESYDIAFVADNPGIWIDHCHNLKHAAEGLIAHLMYEGIDTPFLVGGPAGNRPE